MLFMSNGRSIGPSVDVVLDNVGIKARHFLAWPCKDISKLLKQVFEILYLSERT